MNAKSKAWIACVMTAVLIGVGSPGCAWSIGGKGRETELIPTKGQELIDLKKAKDQELISEEEYETAKKRILEK